MPVDIYFAPVIIFSGNGFRQVLILKGGGSMELRQLEYFLACARCGSITAAEELYTT